MEIIRSISFCTAYDCSSLVLQLIYKVRVNNSARRRKRLQAGYKEYGPAWQLNNTVLRCFQKTHGANNSFWKTDSQVMFLNSAVLPWYNPQLLCYGFLRYNEFTSTHAMFRLPAQALGLGFALALALALILDLALSLSSSSYRFFQRDNSMTSQQNNKDRVEQLTTSSANFQFHLTPLAH